MPLVLSAKELLPSPSARRGSHSPKLPPPTQQKQLKTSSSIPTLRPNPTAGSKIAKLLTEGKHEVHLPKQPRR